MRKFTRAVEPNVLAANCDKWNAQWVKACAGKPSAKFDWYQIGNTSAREHILSALRDQTQWHCAFCDCYPLAGVSNETVEHFKPKARFPALAYTWTNLYYCCDACQTAKREKWDESLLRPDATDFTFERYFEFDFTTGELRPSTLANETDRQRAATTIELYGLDSAARRRNRQDALRKGCHDHDRIHEYAYRHYLGVL